MKYIISLLFMTFMLVACSSNSQKSRTPPKENFVTHTTEDGIKQFSYSLKFEARGQGRMGRSGKGGMGAGRGNRSGKPNKGDMEKKIAERKAKMQERLLSRLDDKLAETQYCNQGYEIIDEYIGMGVVQIKGECNS